MTKEEQIEEFESRDFCGCYEGDIYEHLDKIGKPKLLKALTLAEERGFKAGQDSMLPTMDVNNMTDLTKDV